MGGMPVQDKARALIQERIRGGLRNALAKGKRLGRPKADVDRTAVARLRESGASWRTISKQLQIPVATLHRTTRLERAMLNPGEF